MTFMVPEFLSHFASSLISSKPRPGLQPIPGTRPLTFEAAILPPLVYYLALLFLAPSPPPAVDSITVKLLRNVLAASASLLFFRLPLSYHVPASIGLNYQLGLVGLYGGCRVIDACFIGPYLFDHVPRRVRYHHKPRPTTPSVVSEDTMKPWSDGGDNGMLQRPSSPKSTQGGVDVGLPDQDKGSRNVGSVGQHKLYGKTGRPQLLQRGSQSDMLENMTNESFTELMSKAMVGPDPVPVFETAMTETGWPHGFVDRASWAFELELSMRGVGFTWTTADVRHTRKTWIPTVSNRVHSIVAHVGPILIVCWAVINYTFLNYLAPQHEAEPVVPGASPFDERLPLALQLILTAALGAFLMAAFSFGHSLFAILLSPLAPSPLSFFPPLYTTRIWDITSVRGFWSFGWHRLFARLFLVYGVWPGEWLERTLTGKTRDQRADVGKVLGGFLSSAFVHSFAVRSVLGGDWRLASGEGKFFLLNGLAVILEEGFRKNLQKYRRNRYHEPHFWYDEWIGRVWWIFVLLFTGRNFARGWTKAGLVREMAFL